jgi:prepilin-type processing-associated H-X9-DG protein
MSRNNYRLCFGDFPVHTANLLTNLNATGTNPTYMPNLGTASTQACSVDRGAFAVHKWLGMHSLIDGTSNTLLASERCIATNKQQVRQGYYSGGSAIGSIASFKNLVPANAVNATGEDIGLSTILADARGTGANLNTVAAKVDGVVDYSGKRWLDGALVYSGFVTILPPNGPSPLSAALATVGEAEGVAALVSASSFHPGGVNAVMGDGAVKFYSETIDTTTLNGNDPAKYSSDKAYNGRSVHGVWGALGTRNQNETVSSP